MSFLNLSESAKNSVHIAQSFAREYKNDRFSSAHLLRSLMHKEVGITNFLKSIDKDTAYIEEWADVRMDDYPKAANLPEEINGDEGIKYVFEEADNIRVKLGLDYITPICILAALIKPGVGFTAEQLKSFPLKEKEILELYFKEEEVQHAVTGEPEEEGEPKPSGALHKYCINKTVQAKEGKTDPVVGRDKELRMMMEILCRRTKPNVIIAGDAGVGKTALVDGLAQSIVENKVPALLQNAILYELDTGSLIAGATYKGEIEDRLKNIIREIKRQEKVILFIDEIHSLLDKNGSVGAGAANLLKPELARGELTVIGATTIDEYRKIIEPEQAFTRRFEVLQVAEPDVSTAIQMVHALVGQYQDHHQIQVMESTIPDCVRLAKRYIKDRRLPDAAIDLLDRTMAAIKMMEDTSADQLEELKQKIDTVGKGDLSEDEKLKEYRWLHTLLLNKLSPVLLGKLNDETKVEEIETAPGMETYLKDALRKLLVLADEEHKEVSPKDIAAIVSYKTGIPLGKIQSKEKDKLLNMETRLKQRVVGQDHAVKALSDAILESRSGLGKKGQPIGSFFLLGPTGTGKTELAKSVAEFLFNDEKAMIRFDMSEFKEEHSAALLYGAPPGYVGYEEGGLLVNKIRRQPYSVLLFDEIEKAHPSVFDTFLQIMDEGLLHDRLGKEGDFSNALIIFTSNIGSDWLVEQFDDGLMPTPTQLMEVMSRYFRPEFLARLTEIVPFAPISEENVVRIFDIQLKTLTEALEKQGIRFDIRPEAKKMLALAGFTPKYGARQLSGVIRNRLRRPASRYIISGELKKGDYLKVAIKNADDELDWQILSQNKTVENSSELK